MGRTVNVAIASVGGQGGLTLSRVLAVAAVLDGLSVRTGETLGMAQRYGSVVSYVRIGDRVLSPTFADGEGDYLLGLELIETIRFLSLLKPGGILIVADILRPPILSSLNREVYSEGRLLELIGACVETLILVPARELANEAGNPKAVNMVMLGAFHKVQRTLTDSSIRRAISEVIPNKWLESSLKAFELGYSFVRED